MGLAPTPALEWFSLLWARKGQSDVAGRCPFEPELRLQSKESNTCKALTPKRRRKLGLYAILWALDRSRTRLEFPGSPGIKTMIFHCTRHKFDSWLRNWISHAAAQLEKKKSRTRLQHDLALYYLPWPWRLGGVPTRLFAALPSAWACCILWAQGPRLSGCDGQADVHSLCPVWGQSNLFAWTHLIITLHCLRICIYRVADCIVTVVVGFKSSWPGLRSYHLEPLC